MEHVENEQIAFFRKSIICMPQHCPDKLSSSGCEYKIDSKTRMI